MFVFSLAYHPTFQAPTPSLLPRYQGRTTFPKEGKIKVGYSF